jgi:hypothetical protein
MSKFDKNIDQKIGDKFREELDGLEVPFQPAHWARVRERLVAAMPLYRRWWYVLPWRYAVLSVGVLALLGGMWLGFVRTQTPAVGTQTPAVEKRTPAGTQTPVGTRTPAVGGQTGLASNPQLVEPKTSMLAKKPLADGQTTANIDKNLPGKAKLGKGRRADQVQSGKMGGRPSQGTVAQARPTRKQSKPNNPTQSTVFQPAKTVVVTAGPDLAPPISPDGQGASALAWPEAGLLPLLPLRELAVADTQAIVPIVVAETGAGRLSTPSSLPKWQVGLSITPFVGLGQVDGRSGQAMGAEPTLWLGRRLGRQWWLTAGLGAFAFRANLASGESLAYSTPTFQANNSQNLATNPDFRADLVALSLPLGVRWEFWQRGPHSLSLFLGVRNLAYLRERYVYSQPKVIFDSNRFAGVATTPGNLTPAYLVEEWSYRPLSQIDLAAQGQVALAYQRHWGQRWQWGVGPQWSFPLRKAAHEGLSLHQIGLSVWLWRAGK